MGEVNDLRRQVDDLAAENEVLRGRIKKMQEEEVQRVLKRNSAGPQTIYRYPNAFTANLVRDWMRQTLSGQVEVQVVLDPPVEEDRVRGVGDWAIKVSGHEANTYVTHRLHSCANAAFMCALADALEEANPKHPLLQQHHLKKENRGKLVKYDI